MSFSEYLSSYVKENNISVSKISKTLDIDRATIYRYLNGDRLPKTFEVAEYIAEGLRMTSAERTAFLEEYDKSVLGEDIVNSYLYMHTLLQNMLDADDFITPGFPLITNTLSGDFSEDEECINLSSAHDIISYAMRMFKKSANLTDGSGQIMLFMQPTYSEIQELLIPFFGDSDIRVDQVICFEKTIEKCYINLDILKDILPQSFNLKDYNVYYHYDNLTSHLNSMSLLPNLIVTESCAMMFDYEMNSGFFTTKKTLVQYFTEHFNTMKKTFFTLLEKGNYANDVQHMNSSIEGEKVGTLFNQPCVAPCVDLGTLKDIIYPIPVKDELIASLLFRYGNWEGLKHIRENLYLVEVRSCSTKDGLESFAKTGIVEEFPENYHKPFSVRQRIDVLKRLIVLIKDGRCTYTIMKNGVTFPHSIQIYWNPSNRTVSFRHIKKDNLVQISIKETSIYNTIINALQYVDLKNLAYTQEESIEFINSLISELEKQN